MQRSCLVGLILMAVVLVVASLALQRCYLAPETATLPDAQPTAPLETPQAAPPSATGATGLPTSPQPIANVAETAAAGGAHAERIEGLYLETVRPLADVEIHVRGLASIGDTLYVTAYDANTQLAWLHEIDRSTGVVLRSMPLDEPPQGEPCGLQAAGDILWTCISTEESAQALGIHKGSWTIAYRVPVQGSLRVVVQIDERRLMGIDETGEQFYDWGGDLSLQRVATNGSGAVYSDCEVLRGSLLCAGIDGSGAVLDVIDPASLSLLTRHRASTRTLWGAWVAGNGLAFDGQEFLMVPTGGDFPLLWSYRLDGISLYDYVPGTSLSR